MCRTPLAQRQGRLLVTGAAHLSFRENAVGSNPLERFLIDFLGVGLKNQAFAGPPASGIHLSVEAVRKLILVIMGVELQPQVDVALGLAQGTEELAQVFGIGIAVDHGADHEGGVDNLAEAELLGEVIGATEQVYGRRLALEQLLHAREQHAVGIDQVDLLGLEILLQRLHRGIMTAGLIADRNRNANKVGRIFYL